jgi:alpha,alpha-trehalase
MQITDGFCLCFRFREVYYWDSFWTIKGLLLSELYDTTEGMLRNFKVLL